MIRIYGEEWNGFQFRSPVYLDGHFEPYEFDLVKWENHEPIKAIDGRTGEKKEFARSCYSIGKLTWDNKDQNFEFQSVGLRYLENRIDGLEEWILEFCDEMRKELETE